jgi:hypothetical protein
VRKPFALPATPPLSVLPVTSLSVYVAWRSKSRGIIVHRPSKRHICRSKG